MKNIAEYRKSPLTSNLRLYFFLIRKILTNFALAKNRQNSVLAVVNRGRKTVLEVNFIPIFNPEKATDK